VYNNFFHHIIRVRSNAPPAVRADLEKHLKQQTNSTSTNTVTYYNPSVLSVAPWNPQHRATMIAQLRDLAWYITRLVAVHNRTTAASNNAPQHVLLYYDFTDDSFLYMSSLALAYCMQRHQLSLPAACLRINAASHVYLGAFCAPLQDFEDEVWLHLETQREQTEEGADNQVDPMTMDAIMDTSEENKPFITTSIQWFFSREFEGRCHC
jgi:hypothetical protein